MTTNDSNSDTIEVSPTLYGEPPKLDLKPKSANLPTACKCSFIKKHMLWICTLRGVIVIGLSSKSRNEAVQQGWEWCETYSDIWELAKEMERREKETLTSTRQPVNLSSMANLKIARNRKNAIKRLMLDPEVVQQRKMLCSKGGRSGSKADKSRAGKLGYVRMMEALAKKKALAKHQ